MIKYKIRKFVMIYDDRKEEETNGLKRYVGFLNTELNVEKDAKNAHLFTKNDIINIFGVDRFEKINNWKDEEFEFVWVSNELDEFISKVRLIEKKQFVKEEVIDFGKFGNIVALIGDVKKPVEATERFKNGEWYRNQFYLAWYGLDNLKIADAYCGGIKPDMAKVLLEDKIRRYFDYDDPYKRPVDSDNSFIEDYWNANMEPKREEDDRD